MTILSITNPFALPPLPAPALDPALQMKKPDTQAVVSLKGMKAGDGATRLDARAQHSTPAFPTPQKATGESVIKAKVAEDRPPSGPPIDSIEAVRATTAALPVPIPTSPEMRDALEKQAKEAAARGVSGETV